MDAKLPWRLSGIFSLCLAAGLMPDPVRGQSADFQKEGTRVDETPSADSITAATLKAVERFNDAFNRHDVDAVMAAMTDDCVFENTSPPPEGARFVGATAVREYWEKLFLNSPNATFEAEDIFAAGDRCLVCWIYRKTKDGKPWHLRGVDVFRVRNGKVSEKFSYVKG